MDTFNVPHLGASISIGCFSNVSNAPELRSALVEASKLPDDEAGRRERERLDWAFVEGKMVTSELHVLTAVHQALIARAANDLKTKTVHSEILWMLCPTTNITDAIKRFGLSASTTSLILIKVSPLPPASSPASTAPPTDSPSAPSPSELARSLIHGQPLPLSSIPTMTDWSAVRKVYKLNGDLALSQIKSGGRGDGRGKEEVEEEERRYVDGVVTALVATKSVAQ